MTLLDSRCPVGRHELTDYEWTLLGIITSERNTVVAEEAKKKGL